MKTIKNEFPRLNEDGTQLIVKVPFIEPPIHVAVWQVAVGRVPLYLMEKYFHNYWPCLKLDRDEFLKLGIHPEKPEAGFNMTALALMLSKYSNAVSRKHGEISSRMWQCLWPEAKAEKPAIDHITNAIHLPTWIEPKMRLLFDNHLGSGWLEDHDNSVVWKMIEKIPDEDLWKTHYWLKIKLIDAIRERTRLRWAEDRVNPSFVVAGAGGPCWTHRFSHWVLPGDLPLTKELI